MFHGLGIAAFATRLMPALLLAAITAQGQAPAEFTNLQFFPKTISRDELIGVMRGFSFSLNVRCQYCHVGKSGNSLQEMDFASDDRETKKIARNMLRMVDAINQEYIAKLGRKAPNQVGCVTCHHRSAYP